MKIFASLFSLALFLLFSVALRADEKPCREGDYWVYDIKRTSPAVQSSKFIAGLYKIVCQAGKLVMEDGTDIQYFSDTVPSVRNITANPPWFKSLKVKDTWPYSFEYSSDNRRTYQVSGTFSVEGVEAVSVRGRTFQKATKLKYMDTGHRAGARTHIYYHVAEVGPAGAAVKADIEYASGTVIQLELVEYGSK